VADKAVMMNRSDKRFLSEVFLFTAIVVCVVGGIWAVAAKVKYDRIVGRDLTCHCISCTCHQHQHTGGAK
jgi:hypothetical protein